MLNQYVPVLLMIALAMSTAVGMLVMSSMFGPKKKFAEKMEPFECGVSQVSSPGSRFSVRFYLFAILVIVFDIEAVFLLPWAIIFRELGMFGFIEMMVFIFILTVGLVYVWKKGALEGE